MTKQEAISLVDELEGLIKEGGISNPPILKIIQAHCFSLEHSDLCRADAKLKIGSICEWFEILFSERKHQKYGGYDRVAHFIRMDCSSLREMIERIKE
ncbi:MAG: hypothetical protein ABSA44_12685 [Bacteroidota bacterium]|jgi:hypothetical protein